VQALVLQGRQQPIAQVAIGSIDKTSGLRLTVVVPTAISFSTAAYISGAAGTANLFDLTWRRCLPSGCFADIVLTADALKMMRARVELANLVFRGRRRTRHHPAVLDARPIAVARRHGQGNRRGSIVATIRRGRGRELKPTGSQLARVAHFLRGRCTYATPTRPTLPIVKRWPGCRTRRYVATLNLRHFWRGLGIAGFRQ
jgi:hypothetical protein